MDLIFPTNMPEPRLKYRARFYDREEHEEFWMSYPGSATRNVAEQWAISQQQHTTEFLYLEAL